MPFHHLLISRRLVAHEVDHPAPVWAGGGGSRGGRGPSGDRVPLGGPGGAHRPARPGAGQTPAPACAAPAVHRATRGPSRREPGSRQVFPEVPGARVEAARPPRGEDPLSTPGRRPRSTSWRAGGTGRRNRWTGRSCTLTRSGRCRSARPRTPPCAGRCSRRSAGRALTLRRHDKPTRSARSRPPPPARGPPDAGSPVRRAPSVVVPGRSPATDPNPLADPGRAGSRG